MSTQNRRSSFSSSTASSLAKRHAPSSENAGKPGNAPPPHLAKKRAPLGNLTNQRTEGNPGGPLAHSTTVPKVTKMAKARKAPSASNGTGVTPGNSLPVFSSVKSSVAVPSNNTSGRRTEETTHVPVPTVATLPAQCSLPVSPSTSDGHSVSVDETMSTCESFKSPDVEYIDNYEVSAVDSIDRKTFSSLYISEHSEKAVNICNRDALTDMEMDEKANIDDNYMDPQLCATIACDIYKHLRASEMKKRPSTDFMERIQKDINPSMRAILIDWLVEVAEEYRLVPDTLHLTVNYIDRYLSGNVMNRQRLQLLGVASMMIASKYEEICAPQVEEFCYITDNTYFKDEVLQMESAVLNHLKFELTAPTAKCFLRRFVRAAQAASEVPSMQLECLANYLAELSLLEYSMLSYAPSLIAASSIFLANYILVPSKRPWDSTLQHYTLYQPSDLRECVKELHRLCLNSQSSNLPAIREKYSQHKYKYVAKKHCPPSIPAEFFHNSAH
ncbi:hypothetical protein CDL15_Pgr027906 [Punica granatum]|uniref:Uncharacterized protein n=1 Tax=Punica granatum TaxID=22663 RepID=A0A218XKA7_PUNGR|nr:hypothetical protein CDL15_Pgr027906 [Punica granatum]